MRKSIVLFLALILFQTASVSAQVRQQIERPGNHTGFTTGVTTGTYSFPTQLFSLSPEVIKHPEIVSGLIYSISAGHSLKSKTSLEFVFDHVDASGNGPWLTKDVDTHGATVEGVTVLQLRSYAVIFAKRFGNHQIQPEVFIGGGAGTLNIDFSGRAKGVDMGFPFDEPAESSQRMVIPIVTGGAGIFISNRIFSGKARYQWNTGHCFVIGAAFHFGR